MNKNERTTASDLVTSSNRRQCHDWHWMECDRCDEDGNVHVQLPGHERPLYLCNSCAAKAERTNS